jgi:DNA-binding Lrp family transcriptional regulator
VIALSWIDLVSLFELEPAIRTRLVRLGMRRLLDAIWAEHSQSHEDPDIVLADWLVEFAADLGVAASNRVSFPRRLSQTEIADEIGVSRETISRRLKEWERSGLVVSSAAGLELVDYSRLVRIAGLHSARDRRALAGAVADVEAEIARGDLISARNIGADMLRYFPSSPELLHLVALAAARSGDQDEAIAMLSGAKLLPATDLEALRECVSRAVKSPSAPMERLAADDWIGDGGEEEDEEPDEAADQRLVERLVADIAALEARLLKDRAFEKHAAGDTKIAAESGRAYAAIWRRTGSWYAGVNAAAMALAAGEAKDARAIAGEVLKRVPAKPKEYWAAATLGEALLISGNEERGLAALVKAGEMPDAADSSRASTMLQMRRLASRLSLHLDQVSAALGIKGVALVTGHLFRGSEMDSATQAEAERALRGQAEAIFRSRNVGNLFGALACGTDIVVAETALDLGIPFHAVIPFPLARFIELSVAIGDPPGEEGKWRGKLDGVLAQAASLTVVDDELPLDRDLDGHFYYGFRFAAGQALMRAAVLEAECRLIAVTDGSKATNVAGSNRAVADWIESGRPLDHIEFPFKRRTTSGRARGASSFRPCVLLWDVAGDRADLGAIKRTRAAKDKRLRIVPRTSRLEREGTCIVAPSLEEAIALAERCAEEAGGLRVICDFGPVLGGDMEPDPKLIARLKAGADMPGFPTGRPLATLNFAAQAVVDFGARLDVRAVGRSEEGRATESEAGGRARRRSGLPVFRLSLRDEPAA